MTRIVIADDNDGVRHRLRSILTDGGVWEVCGEAKDSKEVLEQVGKLHPELVILDYLMPEMNGFEAVRKIRSIAPSTKIVMLSIFDTPQMEGAALLIGVDAYMGKAAGATELVARVKEVLDAEDDL
jgi:DNA-binding NarL/FixJ family response regulator